MTSAPLDGTVAGAFAPVRARFAELLADGTETGGAVAVYRGAEPVVDLWGGWADKARTVPWQRDTIVTTYSVTKMPAAAALLSLVDRGLVGLDDRVASVWPEYTAAGKDRTTLRMLLAHRAGQPTFPEPRPADAWGDWADLTAMLARAEPEHEPGAAHVEHALTYGHLVGEVVRRVDGRSVGQFFADEIAKPLGADFHIGLAPEHDDRVAPVIPAPPLVYGGGGELDKTSIPFRAANPRLAAEDSWTIPWRRAEIPAAGGHGNARSVALAQCAVSAGGSARGVELLSAETVERIFDVQAAGRDLVLGIGVTFGVGYGLNSPRAPISPNPRVCDWGGWGGSLVVNDVDAGFTMAYVMNRMGEGTVGDDRAHTILRGVYASLDG